MSEPSRTETRASEADHDLSRRIRQGDPRAERRLYDEHVGAVYHLAVRMTQDAALAEDLTQDVFLRAFDRIHTWRGDGPLGGWLRAITVSVVLTALRKVKRIRQHELAAEDLAHAPAAVVAADDGTIGRLLDQAIAQLSDEHRLVFVMHDVEGYTHREIAASMGTPVGTAKARLSRARTALRAVLQQAFPDLSLESGS